MAHARTCCAAGLALLLVCSDLASGSVAAEPPHPATARFRSLTDVDGLSQMSALALAQDRNGLLWVGTQVGLNRYDGARFRTFDRQSNRSGSTSEHDVSALLNDPDGSLWVGTLSGLYRFDPAIEEVRPFVPPGGGGALIRHQRINALAFDRHGALWIASDGGLSRYFAATGKLDEFGSTLAEHRVLALAEDGSGGLWVGKSNGLWRFDPDSGRFSAFSAAGPAGAALRGWIQTLRMGADGQLWIGTKDTGLLSLQPASASVRQWTHDSEDPASLSHDRVYALLEDAAGQLWIGTEAGADLMLDRDRARPRFVRFQHRAARAGSIAAGRIVSLLQDRAGDLWFGSWSGGASLLSPVRSRFHSFTADAVDPQAVDAAEVVNMTSAGQERIWLGTRRGLFLFDAADYRLQQVAASAGLRVYAVAVDGDTLLLGSDRGLHRYDPARASLERLSLPPALGTPYVDFIVIEADRVFVSTRDADLFVLDRSLGRLLAHHRLDSRAHFMADFQPDLKILGGDRGLYWFSRDGLQLRHRLRANPDDPGALQSDTCHHYLQSADGQQWLATAAGLHRMTLDPGQVPEAARFSVLRNGPGASINATKSLQEDRHGRLWISSNAGITRYDPATGRFTAFGAADGAIDRGYYAFVYSRTAAGRFAFGGASGFTVFDPDRVADLPPPPPPVLTELEIDNRRVEFDAQDPLPVLTAPLHLSRRLEIPAGRGRTLGLGFAAPYFVAPEHLRFAYRLDGFNEDWIETDARRRLASYTNLPPGDYRFRMRVRTTDADWSPLERQLQIRIEPFWWQTRWAQALAALALIGAVSAIFVARLRLLARQRRRLSEQVALATAQSNHALAQMHDAHRALAEAYGRIEQLSRTDPLTGVGNRRTLEQGLPVLLDRAQSPDASRLAFFLLDIDHFKALNDRYGHAAGDAVLSALGALLRAHLPDLALAVRWGGEEFLVVQPVADEAAALACGERLRQAIALLELDLGHAPPVHASVSIGFACFPFDPAAPGRLAWEQVVEIADAALYLAKDNGRNRIYGFRYSSGSSADFEVRLRGTTAELRRSGALDLLALPGTGPVAPTVPVP